jgi:hypothetical protein
MSYTRDELEALGRSDDLTAEAIEKLINDESFFYEVFERATPFCAASIEPGQRQFRQLGTTVQSFELATGISLDGVLYGLDDEP